MVRQDRNFEGIRFQHPQLGTKSVLVDHGLGGCRTRGFILPCNFTHLFSNIYPRRCMKQNPYETPNELSPVQSEKPRFSWKRIVVLNAFWIIVRVTGMYVMSQLNQTKEQLPQRYASYDREITIDTLPFLYTIAILMRLPNLFAYLPGLYSNTNNANV